MACKICETRKPRRYCPGVEGNICAICCGTQREVTVDCPLECPYLREAHEREKKPDLDPKQFPNADIRVNDEFLRRNEPLLIIIAAVLAQKARESRATIDKDVGEALESLVRTYRTLQSGLVYESRPESPHARSLQTAVQEKLEDVRRRLAEAGQPAVLRDADVLGIVTFLQRLEISHNNGRPKSRAFIDFLQHFFPAAEAPPEQRILV